MARLPILDAQTSRRPVPVMTAYTRPFWVACRSGVLQLPRCPACHIQFYPPPPRCPHCLGDKLSWTPLSGMGRIAAWTTVHLATIPGITPPFNLVEVALVEHADLIMSALLNTPSDRQPRIGDAVVFEHVDGIGKNVPYPQFRITTGATT